VCTQQWTVEEIYILGGQAAYILAMKLNVWGGEEDYSVSLEQEEEKSDGKSRAKRARKRRMRIS